MPYNWQTRNEYERTTREVADEIAAAVRAEGRDAADEDCVNTELQSWCDNLVTYTVDCFRILLFSENDQAVMDTIGDPTALVLDGQVNYPLMAYRAVEQDIREYLYSRLPQSCGGAIEDDTFWPDVATAADE